MRTAISVFLGLVILLAIAGAWASRSSQGDAAQQYGSSVVDALSSSTAGFEKVLEPRPFTFPADAGPHPKFQTEWWYYTGNLDGPSGAHYGYQLTFFRRALTPDAVPRKSDWAATQVYFAHFTVTDVNGGEFYADERWARGAAGLAGARASRGGGEGFDAWVEAWSAKADGQGTHLVARSGDVAIDLHLVPEKSAVPQGDRGVSHKSSEPGNASYYYSITRLATRGTVTIGTSRAEVKGSSWLDREWSTSALSKSEVGWDWFSIQLSDGRELMLYQLRHEDGTVDPASSGSVVGAGGIVPLKLSDFSVERTASWKSPHSDAVYPAAWRIRVPSQKLDLIVEPWLQDQELRLSFVYWEGAVKIRSADGTLTGNGYVELVGYARSGAPGL